MTLIGFAGYAGAGKSTIAHAIGQNGGTVRSFSEPLVALLDRIDPTLLVGEVAPLGCYRKLRDIKHWGYEALKRHTDYRDYLIGLGDGARAYEPDIWIDQMAPVMEDHKDKLVLFDSIRYENELDRIQELGGYVVWVTREGVGPYSEVEARSLHQLRDLVDFVVLNEGTPEVGAERVMKGVAEMKFLNT